ncbi:MAG: YfhO family protein [Flavobacteriales bacterium]|nr:YfhO family protein [Flavobacteriales bacterium]MBL6873765.1 YfhO family protein [Flavobacteriales bacterium]
MKALNWKKLLPHFTAIAVFVLISLVYFSPVLEGKKLEQQDIRQFKGMSEEIVQHRAEYDEEPLWTNSMFSGMPAYQISVLHKSNLISYFSNVFKLYLPAPAGIVFLYLLGFYFLLVTLSIDYRLAILGAIAFAFSSYFFIIIEAGHNTKAHAIGYLAPIVASVLMVFRGRLLLGSALTAFFTALMVNANHFQITYYLIMLLFVIGIVKLVEAFKEKTMPVFIKQVAFLLLAGGIGALTSSSKLMTTMEYGAESIRGKSELTANQNNKTSGLDKDYAMAWSYGKAESFTLLIPNFHGGASGGELGTDSETYKLFKNSAQSSQAKNIIKQLPLYWGTQPFTSGPVYAGAIICFLFVLGLFLFNGYLRWWIVISFLLMLTLGWGKNFMPLTDFFLDYIPAYNKFRTVSTTLVIVEFLMPFLGILALNKILEEGKTKKVLKGLKYSLAITGGLCLLFALAPTMFFDFTGPNDQQYGDALSNALQLDRASIFQSDAFRSLILILLAGTSIWLYLSNTLKKLPTILIIGILILGDMWVVNKRYLNNDNFKAKRKVVQPYTPTTADNQILRDTDPNFRVYNTTVSPFNDASTSYFHKSIGGYHGAKLRRYQELIDNHISKGNMQVLNMLNTKYFIVKGQNGPVAQLNSGALGNVWFVNDIIKVENADKEIETLGQINTANQVIVDDRFDTPQNISIDSTASINLTSYKANHLSYESSSTKEQFAVFSEIFYDKGWNAYIDGKIVSHVRANYVLRAMTIPAGKHTIDFKFEPKTHYLGENISLASSLILLLFLIGVFYRELKV